MNNKEFKFKGKTINGFVMLAVQLILIPGVIATSLVFLPFAAAIAIAVVSAVAWFIIWCGFIMVEPNDARVMVFFGKYKGSFYETGYHWVNPFLENK